MSMNPRTRSLVLRVAFIATALLELVAYDRLPDTAIKALVMIAAIVLLVFLWNRLQSGRPLGERRRLLAVNPRARDIITALIIALMAFPWVILCALATRYRIFTDSAETVLITLAPAGAFLVIGLFLIGRAYYRAYRRP